MTHFKIIVILLIVGISCSTINCSMEIENVVALAAGFVHACALNGKGQLKCWGDNMEGQLGVGNGYFYGIDHFSMGITLPVDIGTDRTVVAAAAGDAHTCAILSDETLKCWGWGLYGQLGQGSTENIGDTSHQMGDYLPVVNLGSNAAVSQVSCGKYHTCALLPSFKAAKCWGGNQYGQLGLGSDIPSVGTLPSDMGDNLPFLNLGTDVQVMKILTGKRHTCALLAPSNLLKCWGSNTVGELGNEMGLSEIGRSKAQMGDALPFVNLGDGLVVLDFALGDSYSCAILTGSIVKCWGENYVGELGVAGVQVVGTNSGDMGNNIPAVDLGLNVKAIKIALGGGQTCVLTDFNQVKCWGYNRYGQLGIGFNIPKLPSLQEQMGENLPFVQFGTGLTALDIATLNYATCAILSNNLVKCWGSNIAGELGICSTKVTNVGQHLSQMGDDLMFVGKCSVTRAPSFGPAYDPKQKKWDVKRVADDGNVNGALRGSSRIK